MLGRRVWKADLQNRARSADSAPAVLSSRPSFACPSGRSSHRAAIARTSEGSSVTIGSFHPPQVSSKFGQVGDGRALRRLSTLGMGAGAYVGRIGGLAVALGIGAAVFVGPGVASAEPSSPSGSESSSEATSGTSSSDNKQPAEEKADASTDSSETKTAAAEPKPKKKKKSSAAQQPTAHEAVEPTRETGSATARTVQANATQSTKKADEPKVAEGLAPTVSVTVEKPKEQSPATSTVKAKDPVTVATVAVSSLVSAALNPFAGNAPTAPVESPLPWMMMAAARQEFGRAPTLSKVANPVTTSGNADPVPRQARWLRPTHPHRRRDPADVASDTVATAAHPRADVRDAGGGIRSPNTDHRRHSASDHRLPDRHDGRHHAAGRKGDLGRRHRDLRPLLPGAGCGAGHDGADDPRRPWPGSARRYHPTLVDNPFLANQVIGFGPLLKNGYNVVTWDPRGEWSSGGRLEMDHPDFEGQDMKAIISWLATQPEVALDSPGDPKIGMVGASYGGGIQLVTAAIDPRIDAIVPTIAWNNLNTSLDKNGAPKTSWGDSADGRSPADGRPF